MPFRILLEEDDDIVDDSGLIEYDVFIERTSRKQMFPTDPVNGAAASTQLPKLSAGDRVNSCFNNLDMWTTDDEGDENNLVARCSSGDVSILSDLYMEGDLETVSELASFALSVDQDISDHDEIDDFKDASSNVAKTPATAKRSGGCCHTANLGPLPSLEGDSTRDIAEDDDIEEDPLRNPASVPEDSALDGIKRKSRRKKKTTPSAAPSATSSSNISPSHRRHSNSGRSSKRRSGNVGSRRHSGMERSAMRGSERRAK